MLFSDAKRFVGLIDLQLGTLELKSRFGLYELWIPWEDSQKLEWMSMYAVEHIYEKVFMAFSKSSEIILKEC